MKTVEFPQTAFELTYAQTIPFVNNVETLLAASPNATILEPLVAGAPDTEEAETRVTVQVPQCYVGLVLGQKFTPRRAWEKMAGAIFNHGREAECENLITWLRIALTQTPNAAVPTQPLPPANFLGGTDLVFPPLNEDEDLQNHRRTVLRQDLPALDNSNIRAADAMIQTIGALRHDRAMERAKEEARRVQEKEPKLPSETKFRHTTAEWMRFAEVDDENNLPPIYTDIANAEKSDHISLLRNYLCQRVKQTGDATRSVPVASKGDMVKQAKYYCEPHELSDLTLGLQSFAVGLFVGDKLSKIVEQRTEGFEQMMQGSINPMLAEQATFLTKKIRIPKDLFSPKMMLCTLSVILNVLQGPGARLARVFRHFCTHQWEEINTKLHIQSLYDNTILPQVIPRILKWIKLQISTHIRV